MVLAFDELQSAPTLRNPDARACPDCWSDLHDEPATTAPTDGAQRHRCTRCGAAWESNAAGWLFPLSAA